MPAPSPARRRLLNVTARAVTMQVQLPEDQMELPPLDRAGDRFQPSDAGREILAAVARIERALAGCGAALDAMKGLDAGRVSVGIVSTAKYFAPGALGAFARSHPGIEVALVVGNREDIIAALRGDAIDVAIMGRPPLDIEVEKSPIGEHPHIIVAPILPSARRPAHQRGGCRRLQPSWCASRARGRAR